MGFSIFELPPLLYAELPKQNFLAQVMFEEENHWIYRWELVQSSLRQPAKAPNLH